MYDTKAEQSGTGRGAPLRMTLLAHAKINPFLEITGRRPDGYHTLSSVMLSLSVADTVRLTVFQAGPRGSLSPGRKITLVCDEPGIPRDGTNIAYRAADAYFEAAGRDCDIKIELEKRIPSSAGLGGGSADGAAVLYGLDMMLGRPVGEEKLRAIALKVGSDVPFCLAGGLRSVTGTGGEISATSGFPDMHFLIIKPQSGISTGRAYSELDRMFRGFDGYVPRNPGGIAEAISSRGADGISDCMYNIFEKVLPSICPEAAMIMESMGGAGLCGSGSAVYLPFGTREEAVSAGRRAGELFPGAVTFVCGASHSGVEIAE